MTITILLFAGAADILSQRSVSVHVQDNATLADVAASLRADYPQLSSLLDISRWAVDREFVPLTALVAAGKEVALIPPVSGG